MSKINEFAAAVAQRTHFYKLPPTDFDPLQASDEALGGYGLPPRPPSDAEPEQFAFWARLLSGELKFVLPEFKVMLPEDTQFSVRSLTAGGAGAGPRAIFSGRAHMENSQNWSGLYLKSAPGRRFVKVSGAWEVPTPSIPSVIPRGPDPTTPFHNIYRSSIWVGLDGHRTYPHVSMPQAGTRQYVSMVNGQEVVEIAAWWQWWSMDGFTPEVQIPNMPVKAGDEMLVSLTVVSDDEVLFYVKNQTTKHATRFLVQAPAGSEPIGSTAEWIVERPTWPGSEWPHRMPKLDDVVFSHCHAVSSVSPIAPGMTHRLEHARKIRMYEAFENPYRSAIVSIPEKLGTTGARVFYREAGA